MIKCKNINTYKSKLRANKVKYSMTDGLYSTTHGAKVPFIMPKVSSRKVITHRLHIDNRKANAIFVKILNSTCGKANIEEVAENVVHIYKNQCKKLLGILKEFEYIFDGT